MLLKKILFIFEKCEGYITHFYFHDTKVYRIYFVRISVQTNLQSKNETLQFMTFFCENLEDKVETTVKEFSKKFNYEKASKDYIARRIFIMHFLKGQKLFFNFTT